MSEYSQGVCEDGAAILRDGQPLTIEEILKGLRQCEQLQQQNAELQRELLEYQHKYLQLKQAADNSAIRADNSKQEG